MVELIKLDEYPTKNVLSLLLKDKSTKKNILFATDAYGVPPKTQITEEMLLGFDSCLLQPRVSKSQEEQTDRTRKKAEVFTPSWICNKMNNHCDHEWFGRENVFNVEHDQTWEPTESPVGFEKSGDWKKYVDSKRLEITCGEAPYIVSRYDTTTGEIIPVKRRIGILDRKLRVVSENADSEETWLIWALRAFQSVYGYEFQGDNLLIARVNLLVTYMDYMRYHLHRDPTDEELKKIATVIEWNQWQMDGITGTVPFGKPQEQYHQFNLFDFSVGINDAEEEAVDCKIMDWRADRSVTYRSIKEGRQTE